MVFTRSKARQRARDEIQSESGDSVIEQAPLHVGKGSSSGTVKFAKKVTIKLSPLLSPSSSYSLCSQSCKATSPSPGAITSEVTSSPSPPPSSLEVEETIEQLALKALRSLKKKKGGMETQEPDIRYGTETEDDADGKQESNGIQPDIMTLETPRTHQGRSKSSNKSHRPDMLSSSLKPSLTEPLYFTYSRKKGITSSRAGGRSSAVTWGDTEEEEVMKKSVITADFEKRETAPPMHVSKYAKARARKEAKEKSAGGGWYEMKAPAMTPELQNDLRLLRMRNALDPSQHYKGSDWKKLPKFFQVGKVVSGAADFYSSRIPRRQRKMTIMDELLHNHQFRRYQKKKYADLQRKFSSGTQRKRFIKHKKHYKK